MLNRAKGSFFQSHFAKCNTLQNSGMENKNLIAGSWMDKSVKFAPEFHIYSHNMMPHGAFEQMMCWTTKLKK